MAEGRRVEVRTARVDDLEPLLAMLLEFRKIQRDFGIRTIAANDLVLRGGLIVELGEHFSNPFDRVVVAARGEELVGFIIGRLEVCSPSSEHDKCLRIVGDYITDKSMSRGKILQAMWEEIEEWGIKNGVGYFYGMIHSGNQASIRAAKSVGFKHFMVQFIKYADAIPLEEK